eukprot:1411310-Prorocentrum_lima.AAC.1
MTSSLVGSEMCIRDSIWTGSEPSTYCRKGYLDPIALPTLRQRPVLAHVPVSYTHLTLPTICSV